MNRVLDKRNEELARRKAVKAKIASSVPSKPPDRPVRHGFRRALGDIFNHFVPPITKKRP